MIGSTPPPELLVIPFSMDVYGNVVDFEPVITSSFTGLIALHKWLSSASKKQADLDSSLWALSRDKIDSVRIEMESSFRKMGDSLEFLLSSNEACLKESRQSIAAFLTASPDASKPPVDGLLLAAELCQASLRFNEHGQDGAPQIRKSLFELERASHQIHSMENLVQTQMRPAAVVQVLLRIECARLDEIARAPLDALSLEISRICEQMQSTMTSEFALVSKIHSTVLQMIDFVRSLEQRQISADLRRIQLAEEIEGIHAQSAEQAKRDEELNRIAQNLQRAVSSVINALQYQDIVGQRWEHIQSGFSLIADSAPADPETGWNALVQHAQLVEANAEMSDALRRIDESLLAVSKAETCLSHELDNAIADRRRQLMNVQMHAVMFESWDLARTNEDEMKAIERLISPLLIVAGKMGCQIGEVSHQMRMIALNAQIQATRYGLGTGLEVLAEALRQIADSVGSSGESLDQSSRDIQTVALELQNVFNGMLQQASMICKECDRDFQPLTELLTRQEDASNVLLRQSRQSVLQLQSAREAMQRSFEQAVSSLDLATEISIDCGDFVDKRYRKDPLVLALMKEKQLDTESARYTMASEKDVLLRLAGKATPTVETEKPNTGELDLF